MVRRAFPLWLAALALLALGCGRNESAAPAGSASASPAGEVSLNGAGATFPYPLYSKWMSEYNKLHPGVRINYQSIGSGGGIRQVMAGTVDFGATDSPMTADEVGKAPRKLWHLPTTIGAVVVAYNLPGVTGLKLAQDVLVDIYLGKITKWNDARIAATNPGVALPDQDLRVVYRSDGSGTTGVFTEYLGKISAEWKDKVGVAKSVKWPVGLGAKGNEGVAGQVKTTPGAIGYIELAYAKQNAMTVAAVRNKAGAFIEPSPEASTAAARGIELADDLTASISDSADPAAYPIASYTYLLLFDDAPDAAKGGALARFVLWAVTDGQQHAAALHYAPLPDAAVAKVKARVAQLKAGGAAIAP